MTTKATYPMIPYQQEDRDVLVGLEFNPDDLWEGNVFQHPPLLEAEYLLNDYLVGSTGRRDVLVSGAAFICYDRSNLNVRVGPDCTVAIGVDARAIRYRLLYLPWEVGKMPDFVLEMASHSTAAYDRRTKRQIYESIGIGEFWYFDASGGNLYDEPLAGRRLTDDGSYQSIPLTRREDGSIRGYSPAIDLYLAWERQEDGEGRLCLYSPATGQRLQPYRKVIERADAAEERAESALSQVFAAQEQTAAAEARADAAEAEAERLREELRRLRGE